MKHLLLNFFFPASCALCKGSLNSAAEIKHGLCAKCSSSLELEPGARCKLCGKPLISEIEVCLPCRSGKEKSYDRLWVIYPYTGKYRTLLAAYKFKKNLALASFFTEKILEIINTPLLNEAVIVPVPPRPGKIKENGWDQVDYLCRRLEKSVKKDRVRRLLKRSISKTQKKLSRSERLDNLKGRITACASVPKTVLVIDDVYTTGSTMQVCSEVLKENGAKNVYGFCLFYD